MVKSGNAILSSLLTVNGGSPSAKRIHEQESRPRLGARFASLFAPEPLSFHPTRRGSDGDVRDHHRWHRNCPRADLSAIRAPQNHQNLIWSDSAHSIGVIGTSAP